MNLTEIDYYAKHKTLPDVSISSKVEHAHVLGKVGMRSMEMAVLVNDFKVPALVDGFVSLDNPNARGIHMSRLYLETKAILESAKFNNLTATRILERYLETHRGLSSRAFISVRFNLPIDRKALISEESGTRTYPVEYCARIENEVVTNELGVEVLYSSTCPCSAALARSLIAEKFKTDFSKAGSLDFETVSAWLKSEGALAGTAHAQRSLAKVRVKFANGKNLEALELIDSLEMALGTPVQAAVKRQDEQEFARINAENLMFCEDACRKLKSCLDNFNEIADYKIDVAHFESLHPHDAVAVTVKGVDGGYQV
jgi:GTP cyclohydrolase I